MVPRVKDLMIKVELSRSLPPTEHGARGPSVNQEVGFHAIDLALDHDMKAFSFDVQ